MSTPTSPAAPAGLRPVRRALLSVSDKTGLADLARALAEGGAEIVSTGSTAAHLRDEGLSVTEVAAVTGHPEILGGRVKTLHPRIHGGILGRPDDPGHAAEMAAQGIVPFDLVAVTLYPFEQALAAGAEPAELVEQIDVGGPAMIRAAAKNHDTVAVLTEPADYPALIGDLRTHGGTTAAFRRAMAAKAFGRTAAYDGAIAAWFAEALQTPPVWHMAAGRLARPLRYGENPHQRAALYLSGDPGGLAAVEPVGGKPLSFNNVLDADAAWECLAEFRDEPACVIVKHANPCGVAVGGCLTDAHARALACDPASAFGGIVALSRPLDRAAAEAVTALFTEVMIAPDADEEARAVFARKPNLRLLLAGEPPDPTRPGLLWRQVGGGFLAGDRDGGRILPQDWRLVTRRAPTEEELRDLWLAWRVVKHVRSNAIVLAAGGATVGVGAGQMSRVDAVRMAVWKLQGRSTPPEGAVVMASDAFFPFPDSLEAAAAAGVTAVVQPGGSVRDEAVTEAADRLGLAMLTTGMRHFRH
ncbi:bifunctional phosphoribosylaminoimidazolecarboxamide formyltransferase/IMP cyclohydrolase [Rubellimicrobium sp. CFH 75288]|uniref:bifunctional phosphoribosylaminoimidazolecarboxamide formyltransferase/IMP cyclohydrolase n=1 Tax=Rubellimicrobium sp. CFH 75288 TaxID=2697034 RepID=UPI0014121E26|nr:bifunctional phosphoribosylaminoimidazolecarboxamide formyltransferase/IMP cyclohydrolase [Rubellimicrobium sp. CFH 75288]NAZ37240.1 bifunctional phosphoribosylaminoimidazolecarboxamide formyltransferase/IMP cyclohydrolase [Rubellimicrobium sp. CFH 75288]